MGQPNLQTWNLQWDPISSNQETLSGQLGICSTASYFSVSSKGNSFYIASVIIFLLQIHKIHKKLFPETQCHKQTLLCSGSSEVSQVSTTTRARLTSSAVLVHWLGANNFSKTDSDTDFHIFVELAGLVAHLTCVVSGTRGLPFSWAVSQSKNLKKQHKWGLLRATEISLLKPPQHQKSLP